MSVPLPNLPIPWAFEDPVVAVGQTFAFCRWRKKWLQPSRLFRSYQGNLFAARPAEAAGLALHIHD